MTVQETIQEWSERHAEAFKGLSRRFNDPWSLLLDEDAETRDAWEGQLLEETGLRFLWLHADRDYEGHDASTWLVRFMLNDQVYQVEGWYGSYDGAEIEDPFNFYPVRAVEKTVTLYEKI